MSGAVSFCKPSIVQRTYRMLERVFGDSHKVVAYIEKKKTFFIGSDKQFEFSQHLKTVSGQPITIDSTDFYVPLKVEALAEENLVLRIVEFILRKIFFWFHRSPVPEITTLPSSIFNAAREGETTQFYYDNQKIELIVRQQPLFTDMQTQLLESYNPGYFLQGMKKVAGLFYEKDIPTALFQSCGYLLSPELTLYDAIAEQVLPYSLAEKQNLLKSYEYKFGFSNICAALINNEFALMIVPSGKVLSFLVGIDKGIVFIFADVEHMDRSTEKLLHPLSFMQPSFTRSSKLDPSSIQVTNYAGIWTIRIKQVPA